MGLLRAVRLELIAPISQLRWASVGYTSGDTIPWRLPDGFLRSASIVDQRSTERFKECCGSADCPRLDGWHEAIHPDTIPRPGDDPILVMPTRSLTIVAPSSLLTLQRSAD